MEENHINHHLKTASKPMWSVHQDILKVSDKGYCLNAGLSESPVKEETRVSSCKDVAPKHQEIPLYPPEVSMAASCFPSVDMNSLIKNEHTDGRKLEHEITLRLHANASSGDQPCSSKGDIEDESQNSQDDGYTRKYVPYLECGKRFQYISQLQTHFDVNNGDHSFFCEECGKGFLQEKNLKRHVRMHTAEKPYVCKECGKGFIRQVDLDRHFKIHTGEKPFLCKDCGKSFILKVNFEHHVRIHTGEKPFICKECAKSFIKKSDLYRHFRIHTGEKPYVCRDCGKGFSLKGNLKGHMKTHT